MLTSQEAARPGRPCGRGAEHRVAEGPCAPNQKGPLLAKPDSEKMAPAFVPLSVSQRKQRVCRGGLRPSTCFGKKLACVRSPSLQVTEGSNPGLQLPFANPERMIVCHSGLIGGWVSSGLALVSVNLVTVFWPWSSLMLLYVFWPLLLIFFGYLVGLVSPGIGHSHR